MARIVLPIAGAIVGSFFGQPQLGWAIGSAIGGIVDPMKIRGPSIGEIPPQTAQEGGPIAIVFGRSQPISGNILDCGPPVIVTTTSRQGKGGPKVTEESCYRRYSIGFSEPGQIVKLWRNGMLVFDIWPQDDETEEQRTTREENNALWLEKATHYAGTYTQMPDPLLEEVFGVGTTPAHRGICYIAVDDDLTPERGAVPSYTAVVATNLGDYIPMGPWVRDEILENPVSSVWNVPARVTKVDVLLVGGGAPGRSDPSAVSSVQGYASAGGGGGAWRYHRRHSVTPSSAIVVNLALPVSPTEIRTVFGSLYAMHGGSGSGGQIGTDHNCTLHPVLPQTAHDPETGRGGGQANLQNFGCDPSNYFNTQMSFGGGGGGAGTPGRDATSSEGGTGGGGINLDAVVSIDEDHTVADLGEGGWFCGGGGGGANRTTGGDGGFGGVGGGGRGGPGGSLNVPEQLAQAGQPNTGGGGGGNGYNPYGIVGAGGSGLIAIWYRTDAVAVDTENYCPLLLSEVVEAICHRAGLTQIDVSDLAGICIKGLTMNNSYAAYAALQTLSQAYLFEPSSRDGIIKFVLRGGAATFSVDESDFVDDDVEAEENERRGDSITIPRVLNLSYYALTSGLAPAMQTSERSADRRAKGVVALDTAVILDHQEAAELVAKNHKIMAEEAAGELNLSLPDDWQNLCCTDVGVVNYANKSVRARIVREQLQDGYQTYKMLRDRLSNYGAVVTHIIPPPPFEVPSANVGRTLLEILDMPLLRDADDGYGIGYYIAVAGVNAAWNGAFIELSRDGGANYIDTGTITSAAIIGILLSDLADHPREYPDEVHTVQVQLMSYGSELETTDLAGMLNGLNLAIIGDELIQFADATELSEGIWELSYFLRGRKGTRSAEHLPGERFVVLDPSRVIFVPGELSDLGSELTFRATSLGGSSPSALTTTKTLSLAGRTQVERDVENVSTHMDGSNMVVSWIGVGRLGDDVHSAHGVRFLHYRLTFTGATGDDDALVVTTTAQTYTQDVSALSNPQVAVAQINVLTDDAVL